MVPVRLSHGTDILDATGILAADGYYDIGHTIVCILAVSHSAKTVSYRFSKGKSIKILEAYKTSERQNFHTYCVKNIIKSCLLNLLNFW